MTRLIAGAVVGVTGLKKIIYNAVVRCSARNLVAIDTLDEAGNRLATQQPRSRAVDLLWLRKAHR